MYLFSYQIPQLSQLNYRKRQEIIHQLVSQLPKSQTLLLNVTKLLILIPPFMYAAQQGWRIGTLLVIATILLYPLLMNPITYLLISSKLKNLNTSDSDKT